MTESLLMRAQAGRARFIEETLAGKGELHLLDIEDLVRLTLAMPDELEAMWASVKARLERDAADDLDELGARLRERFNHALALMRGVQARVESIGLAGEELLAAIRTIEQRRDRLMGNWPWKDRPRPRVDRAMIRQSFEETARGEGEDVTSILARVRQGGPLIKE